MAKLVDVEYEVWSIRRIGRDEGGTENAEVELRAQRDDSGTFGNATVRVPLDKVPGLDGKITATFNVTTA